MVASAHEHVISESRQNEIRMETLPEIEQMAAVARLNPEELPEQAAYVAPTETITERTIVRPVGPVHTLTMTEMHRGAEPTERPPEVRADSGLSVELVKIEMAQAAEAAREIVESQPELVLPAVQVMSEANEWSGIQEDTPDVPLVEPLVVELSNDKDKTEPVMLATLDGLLAYASEQIEARDEAAAERLEESVETVEQAMTTLVQLEEFSSVAPEVVDEIIAERIDVLLGSFDEVPETIEELMTQLGAMEGDEELELRALLTASVELLQELGVREPTIDQVISLARALVVRAAVEHQSAIAPTIEDEWTEDKSIAGERYGLFGAWRLSGFDDGIAGHPLGQLVLRASLVGT